MDLIVILIAIPTLLILGHLISWVSDQLWFSWLALLLWWYRRHPTPTKEVEPWIEQAPVPPTHLPTPDEAKRREELHNLDTTDPEFQAKFAAWMEEANAANQQREPHVPRYHPKNR